MTRLDVPEINRFLGIVIYMYYNDHESPHVHARYNELEMRIDVTSLRVLSGGLPPRSRQHVMDWGELRRFELLNAWTMARQHRPLPRIELLE